MKNTKFKDIMKSKKVKTGAMLALMMVPSLALATGDAAGEAKAKINSIGKTILLILTSVAGIWLTIIFVGRGMKIAQGEMSMRELVPPIAGGVITFLAYYLAKVILDNMFKVEDVNF